MTGKGNDMKKERCFTEMDLLEILALDAFARANERHGCPEVVEACDRAIIDGICASLLLDSNKESIFLNPKLLDYEIG